MTIGIDARLYGRGLGLGRYISKLIEHLERIDSQHHFVIFLRESNYTEYLPQNSRFRKVCVDIPWYSLSEQLFLPRLFLQEQCDLIHIPHFNIPLFYPGVLMITIHDLILMKHPQSATLAASTRNPFIHWLKYQGYRFIIRSACMRACRIVTVSHAVAHDIEQIWPVYREKLQVVWEAADFFPLPHRGDTFNPGTNYFLYAGNAYPHKNLDALLYALIRVHERYPQYSLMMCGQEDFFQKRLIQQIQKKGITSRIHHLGCISDEHLRILYERATALILPSRAEGFGLQIIEAFLHGCPVIASDIDTYREVGGDAALLIDTREPSFIADAMFAMIEDQNFRRRLIDQGRIRARDFSWDKTAEQTYRLYNECLGIKEV